MPLLPLALCSPFNAEEEATALRTQQLRPLVLQATIALNRRPLQLFVLWLTTVQMQQQRPTLVRKGIIVLRTVLVTVRCCAQPARTTIAHPGLLLPRQLWKLLVTTAPLANIVPTQRGTHTVLAMLVTCALEMPPQQRPRLLQKGVWPVRWALTASQLHSSPLGAQEQLMVPTQD